MNLMDYILLTIIILYPIVFIYECITIQHTQKVMKRNSFFTKGIIKDVGSVSYMGRHYYQDITLEYKYNGTICSHILHDVDLNYACMDALGFIRKKGFNINEEIDIFVCKLNNSVHLTKAEHNTGFILFVCFGAFFLLDLFFIGLAMYLYFIRGEAFF